MKKKEIERKWKKTKQNEKNNIFSQILEVSTSFDLHFVLKWIN